MTITKEDLLASFPARLISSLKNKGFASSTANSGVRVGDLARAIGVTSSACNKYISGIVLPDYAKILMIASWLDVDVTWLMYGDEVASSQAQKAMIDCDTVETILTMALPVFEHGAPKDVVHFIMNELRKAADISTDRESTLNSLKSAISSSLQFSEVLAKTD
jgi:transcriptional regulator with XRE-family HTH domain